MEPQNAIYDARQLGMPRMLILGFQHLFVMFGATVLVPLLTGLDVSVTLLFAGIGTLLFHFISKWNVPAFLGSSFAFLGGYASVKEMGVSQGLSLRRSPSTMPVWAWPVPDSSISSWRH